MSEFTAGEGSYAGSIRPAGASPGPEAVGAVSFAAGPVSATDAKAVPAAQRDRVPAAGFTEPESLQLEAFRVCGVQRVAQALQEGFLTATEVADYLVRKGLSFREAHGIAGQVVRYCEKQGIAFDQLSLQEWRSFTPEFDEDVMKHISPAGAVAARNSPGGTAPARVKEQIAKARKLLSS